MDSATVNATTSAIDSAANYMAQSNLNKKMLEYNREMYDRQKADNLANWERQNAYNTPAQQMQRLKEAGLNPHLIYGGSGNVSEASPVQTTNTQAFHPTLPNITAGSDAANLYIETRRFDAQQKLVDAQTLKVLSDVNTQNFDLGQKQRLADTQASIINEILNEKQIHNAGAYDNLVNQSVMRASTLTEAATRIAKNLSDIQTQEVGRQKTQAETKRIGQDIQQGSEKFPLEQQQRKTNIENAIKDGRIKDFEIKLNQAGFTKSDPYYFRVGKTILDYVAGDVNITEAKKAVEQMQTNLNAKVFSAIMEFLTPIYKPFTTPKK